MSPIFPGDLFFCKPKEVATKYWSIVGASLEIRSNLLKFCRIHAKSRDDVYGVIT